VPTKQAPRQTLDEWAVDLCWVKECRDGFVSIEINGYSTLFACPQCDRAYMDRPGYTSIPSIKRWKGRLELYSDVEMVRRQEDRKDVIGRLRAGKRAQKILGTEGIERIGMEEEQPQGGKERETV
jgi:hypothetical protein